MADLRESMKDMANLTRSVAYNEKAFRYLLESESKRSERSGHLYQILLVYRTNAQGAIVRMDPDIAKTVIAALSRSLRDTDYIGWYRAECVVGGVLTVVGRDSVADLFNRLRPRLREILAVGSPRQNERVPGAIRPDRPRIVVRVIGLEQHAATFIQQLNGTLAGQ